MLVILCRKLDDLIIRQIQMINLIVVTHIKSTNTIVRKRN